MTHVLCLLYFSQGYSLKFFLIFIHIWWYSSWGFGVFVMDWDPGVGFSVDGVRGYLGSLELVLPICINIEE